MSYRSLIVEPFRDLPGAVEIVGLGRVRPPSGGAQELEVAVALSSADVADGADHLRWVGCGQLDLLTAGSLWSAGQRIDVASQDHAVAGSFMHVGDEELGLGVDQPGRGRPFRSARIASAPAFRLKRIRPAAATDRARAVRTEPDLVILPHMELVRTLFGVSGRLLLEMFDGIRSPAVSIRRGLIDRRLSRRVNDDLVKLVVGAKLSRDEAIAAAAMIADSRIGRLHDRVHQQLSVNRDFRDGRPEHVRVAWPGWRELAFQGMGRWIERFDGAGGTERRFLVTRLTSISPPLPFDRVEMHFPGTDDEDGGEEPPSMDRRRLPNARDVVLVTARPSSSSRRPLQVPTGHVDLPTADGIEVISVPRGSGIRSNAGVIGEDPRDEAPFATGGDMSGADAQVGRAALSRGQMAGKVSDRTLGVARGATWDALRLACEENRWQLAVLSGGRLLAASADRADLNLDREALVATIRTGDRRLLVVDGGSVPGDERSLGILVPRDRATDDFVVSRRAKGLCESLGGRWRREDAKSDDFTITTMVRRPQVWESRTTYAEALARKLRRAAGLPAE